MMKIQKSPSKHSHIRILIIDSEFDPSLVKHIPFIVTDKEDNHSSEEMEYKQEIVVKNFPEKKKAELSLPLQSNMKHFQTKMINKQVTLFTTILTYKYKGDSFLKSSESNLETNF